MNQEIIDIIRATYEPTTTGWRRTTNRQYKTAAEIQSTVSAALSASHKFNLMSELVDIPDWLDENLLVEDGSAQTSTFVSPEMFIDMVVKNYDITISPNGSRITRKMGGIVNKDITPEDLLLILKSSLIDFNRGREARLRVKEKDVEIKLYDYLLQAGHNQLYIIGDELGYVPECVSVLDKWLSDMYKLLKISEPFNVWEMMMKHMMWVIKRQMYSKKVVNDIWLQVFGKQGTGKTFVTKEVIFSPLRDFYCETELSKIEDFDREIEKFTKYLVINFDEVALGQSNDPQYKIGKRQLNNLKSLLTRETFTVRVMRTQKQVTLAKSFTAFSSANTHLYDVIFDETGMRRFFEFTSEQPFDTQFNHAEVAALKAMSEEAWKGIDENIEKGYWDKKSEAGLFVLEAQQSYFPTTSTVKLWTIERNVTGGTTTLDEAYSDYQDFCRDSGNSYIVTKQNFISDMRIICKDIIDEKGMLQISFGV